VVLDHIGAPYLARNLDALAANGRLVLIATMGGGTAEIDLRTLMRKRLAVMGSTLRGRPVEEKAALVEAFLHRFGADLVAGRVRPVVDRVYPLAQAPEAHRRMATSLHFGKLVLRLP
jgi:NADPH:quinone reductase-like Zn-dependent oxidoreductase